MGVGGHGVPDAAGVELSEAHDELAGFDAVGVDVFVDGAFVGGGFGAEFDGGGLRFFGEGNGVRRVGGIAEEIELRGGGGGVGGGEEEFFVAAADVEAVEVVHFVGDAVDGDGAFFADVEDAELASFEEVGGAELVGGAEGKGFGGGDGGTDDGAIDITIDQGDFVGGEEGIDEERSRAVRRWSCGRSGGVGHEVGFHRGHP